MRTTRGYLMLCAAVLIVGGAVILLIHPPTVAVMIGVLGIFLGVELFA